MRSPPTGDLLAKPCSWGRPPASNCWKPTFCKKKRPQANWSASPTRWAAECSPPCDPRSVGAAAACRPGRASSASPRLPELLLDRGRGDLVHVLGHTRMAVPCFPGLLVALRRGPLPRRSRIQRNRPQYLRLVGILAQGQGPQRLHHFRCGSVAFRARDHRLLGSGIAAVEQWPADLGSVAARRHGASLARGSSRRQQSPCTVPPRQPPDPPSPQPPRFRASPPRSARAEAGPGSRSPRKARLAAAASGTTAVLSCPDHAPPMPHTQHGPPVRSRTCRGASLRSPCREWERRAKAPTPPLEPTAVPAPADSSTLHRPAG